MVQIVWHFSNFSGVYTGMDEESGEKTVGMRLGSYATGTIGVAPVYYLPHVPDRMKDAVRVIYDRDKSLTIYSIQVLSKL